MASICEPRRSVPVDLRRMQQCEGGNVTEDEPNHGNRDDGQPERLPTADGPSRCGGEKQRKRDELDQVDSDIEPRNCRSICDDVANEAKACNCVRGWEADSTDPWDQKPTPDPVCQRKGQADQQNCKYLSARC